MASFNIKKGSLGLLGDKKVGMIVTFKSDDGREVTNYHEAESTNKAEIEQELQKAANEFEGRDATVPAEPKLTTAQDMSVELAISKVIA